MSGIPQHITDEIQQHLNEIGKFFRNPKVTLLVRPDIGPERDADALFTQDSIPAVVDALWRRADAGGGARWCVHVIGPDDVHAAPDWETAARWAMMLNRTAARLPESDDAPLCIAQVERWPHSSAAHAEALPAAIAGMTPREEA